MTLSSFNQDWMIVVLQPQFLSMIFPSYDATNEPICGNEKQYLALKKKKITIKIFLYKSALASISFDASLFLASDETQRDQNFMLSCLIKLHNLGCLQVTKPICHLTWKLKEYTSQTGPKRCLSLIMLKFESSCMILWHEQLIFVF